MGLLGSPLESYPTSRRTSVGMAQPIAGGLVDQELAPLAGTWWMTYGCAPPLHRAAACPPAPEVPEVARRPHPDSVPGAVCCCRHSIVLVAARAVLIPLTMLFTMFPFLLGVLCVMIIGGPFVAAASFLITVPVGIVSGFAAADVTLLA